MPRPRTCRFRHDEFESSVKAKRGFYIAVMADAGVRIRGLQTVVTSRKPKHTAPDDGTCAMTLANARRHITQATCESMVAASKRQQLRPARSAITGESSDVHAHPCALTRKLQDPSARWMAPVAMPYTPSIAPPWIVSLANTQRRRTTRPFIKSMPTSRARILQVRTPRTTCRELENCWAENCTQCKWETTRQASLGAFRAGTNHLGGAMITSSMPPAALPGHLVQRLRTATSNIGCSAQVCVTRRKAKRRAIPRAARTRSV